MNKKRRIPLWISIFLGVTILFMVPQIYMFYFNHSLLLDAGISIEGAPDINIMFTTAGRLTAMVVITIFALFTQNPNHFLIVYLLAIFREGQETFIDPMFPYINAGPAWIDISMHLVIVAIEILAFIKIYKIAKCEKKHS